MFDSLRTAQQIERTVVSILRNQPDVLRPWGRTEAVRAIAGRSAMDCAHAVASIDQASIATGQQLLEDAVYLAHMALLADRIDHCERIHGTPADPK